jgi:hypothetical protein
MVCRRGRNKHTHTRTRAPRSAPFALSVLSRSFLSALKRWIRAERRPGENRSVQERWARANEQEERQRGGKSVDDDGRRLHATVLSCVAKLQTALLAVATLAPEGRSEPWRCLLHPSFFLYNSNLYSCLSHVHSD